MVIARGWNLTLSMLAWIVIMLFKLHNWLGETWCAFALTIDHIFLHVLYLIRGTCLFEQMLIARYYAVRFALNLAHAGRLNRTWKLFGFWGKLLFGCVVIRFCERTIFINQKLLRLQWYLSATFYLFDFSFLNNDWHGSKVLVFLSRSPLRWFPCKSLLAHRSERLLLLTWILHLITTRVLLILNNVVPIIFTRVVLEVVRFIDDFCLDLAFDELGALNNSFVFGSSLFF